MPGSDRGEPEEGTVASTGGDPGACDPLPADVRAAASAAYSYRSSEADVASLVFDSIVDASSGEGPRYVVFRGPGLTVAVTVAADRSVVGRLVPPLATEVVLRWPGGSCVSRSDEFGCFVVPNLPPGPATLQFPAQSDGSVGPMATEWTVL